MQTDTHTHTHLLYMHLHVYTYTEECRSTDACCQLLIHPDCWRTGTMTADTSLSELFLHYRSNCLLFPQLSHTASWWVFWKSSRKLPEQYWEQKREPCAMSGIQRKGATLLFDRIRDVWVLHTLSQRGGVIDFIHLIPHSLHVVYFISFLILIYLH